MDRPIAISLSPNAEKDDIFLSLRLLFSPWKWFDQNEVLKLEREFAGKFGKEYKALAVNSGRSAQFLILKALGIGKGDEVMIQAFTCVAVPNSILWLGAKPVYLDIDETYNIDTSKIGEKLTQKTRAIIVQHTFGIPANIDMVKRIVQKMNIPIIEDCAVSLGARYKEKMVGTFGNASFFSFGRDKIISSVFGGMILCSDNKLYEKLKEERDKLGLPGLLWTIEQLLHPIVFSIILPLYNFGFGKITLGKGLIFFFQKIKLVSRPVYEKEKIGKQPKYFPAKLPGVLAFLALNQLKKLDRFNNHRIKIANFYFQSLKKSKFQLPSNDKGAVWLRFPILHKGAQKLLLYSKKKGLLLGDWYSRVVVPVKNLSIVEYKSGSCPKAEKCSKKIVNLPTYPNLSVGKAREVVAFVKEWENTL